MRTREAIACGALLIASGMLWAGCDDTGTRTKTASNVSAPPSPPDDPQPVASREPPPPQDTSAARADAPIEQPEPAKPDKPPRLPPPEDDRAMQAWSLIRQARYDEARALLNEILAEYPDFSQAEFFIGVSYQKQKDYVQAKRQFEKVIASGVHFPMDETTYYFYGWSLYWLGQLPEARQAFETHRKASPKEADTYFALGLIDYEEDKLDDAEAHFNEAIELHEEMARTDPARYRSRLASVAKCHGRLADVYIRRNQLEPARDQLNRAIELWPAHHQTYYKLYRVLLRLGDKDGAESALRTQQRILRQRGLTNGDDD